MATNQRLQQFAAPALLVPEDGYNDAFMNKLMQQLRLYFNANTNALNTFTGNAGGKWLTFPYGQIYSTASQTVTANTVTRVQFNTAAPANGVSLTSNQIKVSQNGVYKIVFTVQLKNADTGSARDVDVWLRLNGTDVVASDYKYTVEASHGGVPGYALAVGTFIMNINAADYVEVYWAANSANVSLVFEAAQTAPYAHPSVPAATLNITFLSVQP